MESFPSFFDEERINFSFKPLGLNERHPIQLSQSPILFNFARCKDLSSGETFDGMFAVHNTLLAFYGVKILYIIRLIDFQYSLIYQKLQKWS